MKISSASLEIVNRCNLKCKHCFNDSHSQLPHIEMDINTTDDLLANLSNSNQCKMDSIWVSGGEPTEHSNFNDIIELIHSYGHKAVITSNGIYNDSKIKKINDAREHISRLHISLEGLKENTDDIRGNGCFDHITKKVIAELKKNDLNLCITVHLRKQNQHEIKQLAKLIIDELGCELKLGILRPVGRAKQNLVSDMLSPLELYNCIKKVHQLKEKYEDKIILNDWKILANPKEPINHYACASGMQRIITFAPNYDVFPCDQLKDPVFCLGNFKKEKDLSALLEKEYVKHLYSMLRCKNKACNQCRFFKVSCCGGCPAIAYNLKNTLESLSDIDPYCFANLIE